MLEVLARSAPGRDWRRGLVGRFGNAPGRDSAIAVVLLYDGRAGCGQAIDVDGLVSLQPGPVHEEILYAGRNSRCDVQSATHQVAGGNIGGGKAELRNNVVAVIGYPGAGCRIE